MKRLIALISIIASVNSFAAYTIEAGFELRQDGAYKIVFVLWDVLSELQELGGDGGVGVGAVLTRQPFHEAQKSTIGIPTGRTATGAYRTSTNGGA